MSDSSSKSLSTIDGVLEALGGGTKAARLAECTPQNLTNALRRGRLPASTFLIFSDELQALGFSAPPELWGIKPSRKRRG